MIRKLHLKNFLSYKDVTISFNEFNVIVGANASGKTNLTKALNTLRGLISGGFNSIEDFDAFMENTFHKNSPETEPMVFEIEVENPVDIALADKRKIHFAKHHYYLELQYSVGVVKEWYKAWEKGQAKPYTILQRENGKAKFAGDKYDPAHSLTNEVDKTTMENIMFQPLVGKAASPFLMMIIQAFCDFLITYNLIPHEIVRPFVSRNQKVVSVTGSNLAGVLQFYKDHKPEVIDSINEILSRNIPNFVSVDTKPLGISRNYLFFVKEADGKDYMLNELSEGTDVFVALVAAMVTSQYVELPEHFTGIMIVEEPEKNLHPQLMEELVALAKSLTGKFQVIMTTHSSDLVSHLQPEDLILLDKNAVGSRVKRVSQTKDVKKYLEEFSLDQIWLNNDLNGGTING